ncbi:MAG: tetratricopeptide repeat protein [Nitrospinota bacterium]|nr:tetratricopeptide repeat protein [Nitrospinota bacterium]
MVRPGTLYILIAILVFAACTSRQTLLLQEAENRWYKNEYSEAVRIFIQIIDRYPDTPEAETALLRAGETFMLNLSDHNKALEYFKRLTEEFPHGEKARTARINMASIMENTTKDYDSAVIQYQILIDNSKGLEGDVFQFALARCFYKKNDYEQAIIEYKNLRKRFPSSKLLPEASYQIGNCYFVMNNCEEAIKQYEKTLENFPDIPERYDIMLSTGVCLEGKEDYGQALHIYREILDKYPNTKLIERKIDAVLSRMRDKNR